MWKEFGRIVHKVATDSRRICDCAPAPRTMRNSATPQRRALCPQWKQKTSMPGPRPGITCCILNGVSMGQSPDIRHRMVERLKLSSDGWDCKHDGKSDCEEYSNSDDVIRAHRLPRIERMTRFEYINNDYFIAMQQSCFGRS